MVVLSSSSSVLGERLAPPPPPRIWPTVLAGAIAALAAFVLALHLFWQQGRLSYEQFWWWRLIFFVACGITILGFIRFVVRRDHWNDEYDDWSELWICLACGMVSDHPQDDARPLRAIPRAVSGKLTSKLLMLLVVFFGLETAAAAQGKVVTIAENAILASPGASIDFPAVDVRLVSEVSLLGKTTGIGVNIFVKFSTVSGLFGDSVPAVALPGGAGCFLDPVAGVNCGVPRR